MIESIKKKIETLFERAGLFVFDHPVRVLTVTIALIGFLAVQIPSVRVDTSSEALLQKNDPSLLAYNTFRDQFGRSELLIVAITAPDFFSPSFVRRLQAFQDEIEETVPYVRNVTSLINIRDTRGENDELIVEDFLENWQERDLDFPRIKSRAAASHLFRNYILSENLAVTAVIIETDAAIATDGFDTLADGFEEAAGPQKEEGGRAPVRYFSAQENREVVAAVDRVVDRHSREDFRLIPSGGPVIVDAFNRATMTDIQICIVLALSAVTLFLMILFRRISGVILPVIIILSSLVSTMGLMSLVDVPIKITTTVIPGFLLAVGVADAVHILVIFYRYYGRTGNRREAVSYACGHSGLAILMTSLTTSAGLLSFTLAELGAIAEIGYFAAAGVLLAFLYTIAMLPAMLAIFPIRPLAKSSRSSLLLDNVLIKTADFSCTHPVAITIVSILLLLVSTFFLTTLEFSHNIIRYFPADSPEKNNLAFIDKHLKGSMALEVVVDTKVENGIYDPELLHRIDEWVLTLQRTEHAGISVGKAISINNVVKEINQALANNDPDAYAIPEKREAIAQELLLFENSGSDDLEKLVDSRFSKTRITLKTPWADAVVCRDFIDSAGESLAAALGNRVDISITGIMALLARAISAAIFSMTKSYTVAFIVITAMMIFLLGKIKIGLISMFPNLLPIVIIMGIMGWLRVPLDLNTLMIGSIAIGLVVDDTVHFMYNFQRYYNQTRDAQQAIRETLLGTGRALLITSLVLSTGFFVLLAATLNNLVRFGIFTGCTILLALLADFLLAPALMVLVTRNRRGT